MFVNVLVLIPLQLGFLFWLAKRRGNRGGSLEGVVVLASPLRLHMPLPWTVANLVPTGIVFGLFEPITNSLDALAAYGDLARPAPADTETVTVTRRGHFRKTPESV